MAKSGQFAVFLVFAALPVLYFYFKSPLKIFHKIGSYEERSLPSIRDFSRNGHLFSDIHSCHCLAKKPDRSLLPDNNRGEIRGNQERSLSLTTDVAKSVVEIMNPRVYYHVCDTLAIKIQSRAKQGTWKTYGGDYFRVKLFTDKPYSAIGPDYFFDYENGTYLALFTLRWPGTVRVDAMLVHPSEAVQILNRTQQGSAATVFTFYGTFQTTAPNGTVYTEDVTCGVAPFKPPMCNVSAKHTHGPWFCKKPTNEHLSCDDWAVVFMSTKESSAKLQKTLSKAELAAFKSTKTKLKTLSLPSINVRGAAPDPDALPTCTLAPVTSSVQTRGFYYNNTWQPYHCSLKSFKPNDIQSCMTKKTIHIYGDSTGRQMYYYLQKSTTCDNIEISGEKRCVGNGTTLRYKFHGPPIRGSGKLNAKKLRYVAEEIDDLEGGPDVFIILSIWAHFGVPDGTFYRDRLEAIKSAVGRLWQRSPETKVIVRSANTREHSIGGFILISSDWIALQGEKTLRDVFSQDRRFSFLDVWDMTLVQKSKDSIHPLDPTLIQIMNHLLTMMC
ncbi:NXPE family member 3-like [Apostichopus japonicus]|uniref:NXPE family member 3-like n=1 Tax=Stichopus japonicus TaxID=307972 RepID=UPI003AB6970C